MTVFSPTKPSSPPAPASPHSAAGRFGSPPLSAIGQPSTKATRGDDAEQAPRYWPTWAMLTVFVFISFECILLAAAMKGSWFILLAPGVVCGVKAWDMWKQLKRAGTQ